MFFSFQTQSSKAFVSKILTMLSKMSFMPLTSFAFLLVTCFFHLPMQVYDVTQYLDDHPGGDDVILEATGTQSL